MCVLGSGERIKDQLTSEHVLALAVQDTGTWLQVLAAQKVGHGDGNGIGRARSDGLGDALLGRVRVSVWWLAGARTLALALRLAGLALGTSLLLSLLLGLLLSLYPRDHLGALSLHVLHVLLGSDARFMGGILDLGLHVGL